MNFSIVNFYLLQELIEKIVTNHKTLEILNTLSSGFVLDLRDQRAMDLRNNACHLNDRWDKLYEQAKCNAEYAKKHLNPWFSYRKKIEEMTKWLESTKSLTDIELKQFQKLEDAKKVLDEEKVKFLKMV